MPEHRPFPWKYIPRLGVKLSITFGDPLSPEDIRTVLRTLSHENCHRHASVSPAQHSNIDKGACEGGPGEDRLFGIDRIERVRERMTRECISMDLGNASRRREIDRVRSMVTAVIQQGVENVGKRVSGDTLGKKTDR
jgi:monolysocardiolipin acyltransferase